MGNIGFKTYIIRSFIINIYYNLCDYSHAYILIEGTVTVPNTVAVVASVN